MRLTAGEGAPCGDVLGLCTFRCDTQPGTAQGVEFTKIPLGSVRQLDLRPCIFAHDRRKQLDVIAAERTQADRVFPESAPLARDLCAVGDRDAVFLAEIAGTVKKRDLS